MKDFAILVTYFVTVAFFFMFLCLSSCKTPQVVTVTKVERIHDTVRSERVDSIYKTHYVYAKGDTVLLIDTLFKYQRLTDTLCVYKCDSIPYEVRVEVPVRVRNGYDRFTSWGFWILALLLCARIAWWAFKTFYLRR